MRRENYVKEFTHKHFIIRSNWVFGKGNNFVNRVLEAADQGRALAVAEDQYGSPTSAKDLARIILHLIRTNEYGTYHATCQGVCNRYEFAKEILRLAGKEEQLNPVLPRSLIFLLPDLHMQFWIISSFALSMYMRCLAGRILWKNL